MWAKVDSMIGDVTVYRIRNAQGWYLVEFVHEPNVSIKLAVWSWSSDRGFPFPTEDAAKEVIGILHHEGCEIVETTMHIGLMEFF